MGHTVYGSEYTAPERGTVGIEVVFRDEEGTLLTPNVITWTLTNKSSRDVAATVINGRDAVSVTPPANTIVVVLSGDDLTFLASEDEETLVERVLTIEYTYNSNLGTNLPGKAQYIFPLERLYVGE